MLYAMKDYENMNITYPITVRNYINTICTHLGLTFKNSNDEFANYDKEIQNELYLDNTGASLGYTFRDVFDELAQATGSTICINETDDELEIRYINELINETTEVEGSNIYITDNEGDKLSLEELQGNTIQDGTPTPDNPVEIQTVTGEQNVNVYSGKNLFNNNGTMYQSTGATVETIDTGIRATILRTGNNRYGKVVIPNSNELLGKTVTLSANFNSSASNTGRIALYQISSTGGVISGIGMLDNTGSITLTIPSEYSTNAVTLALLFYANTSGTSEVNDYVDYTNVQLELGSQVTEYEEYIGQDYKINLGKNLINNIETTQTINGITYTVNDDGSVLVNGTATALTVLNIIGNNTFTLPEGIYTISGCPSGGSNSTYRLDINDGARTEWRDYGNSSAFALTEDTLIRNVRIRIAKGATIDNLLFKPMLEKGSQATPYSPYFTPIELCKIEDYKDRIYKQNDTWYIEKNIGKVVLDGSESWSYNNELQLFVVSNLVEYLTTGFIPYSNYYKGQSVTQYRQMQDGYISFLQSTTQNRLIIKNTSISTVADFKTWLSTHNTIVYYVLETPTYEEITNEELIDQLNALNNAKLNYGINNIVISSNNLNMGLKISYISDYETIDEKYLKDINVNFGEKYGPINSIVLSRADESDSVFIQDENSIEQNGLCEIKIKENQIMNFNDRSDYLPDLLEKLNGLEYYINDFVSTGITYLELCDKYKIKIFDKIYPCIMFNDESNITQGLSENIHTDMPEESETDYKKADKTDRKINQTYIIADKQKGQIEALTSRTETLENKTGDMYSKEQVNQLIINAETGLTNTFSEAGGNNIFRNTGLWFTQSDNNNPYEFWTGIVEKVREEKSASTNALLLQNTTLIQEQDVPNGNYTISFKYKKLIQASQVKCVINDVEYILTATEDTEFVQPIEVNSQHINIKFISNIDNACEIYDLMVNAGAVKLAYSQNQNETTTDTVNISKGITITSSQMETTFKANADGVRIYDSKDLTTPKTEFTDRGMETDYLKAKNEAEIVSILIQKVGNHTWFTKI